MDWQPIETMPPATPVLLYYEKLGVKYGFYDDIGTADWWVADMSPKCEAGWSSPFWDNDHEPTHWMPLPEAPK